MIGRIAGQIVCKGEDHALIDVRGVGYVVYCTDRVLAGLAPGEAAALFTDLMVREDLLQLYGFPTLVEKEWFRLLMTVQGVGAKAALAMLGALGPDGVSRALALGDWTAIKAAKGIGPKTAQRVVNELKDKAPMVMAMGAGAAVSAPPAAPDGDAVIERAAPSAPVPVPSASAQAEALSALGNLGYGPGAAAGAVAQAAGEAPEADTAGLIRAALKLLAPKG
ncbi:Holliday junction branch migration protein RuvA [Ponticoccus alexandrii]|uniref:Holliday junction branch migration complex subunit RuvA n=1 Tax=Ponticoccus alexandrii TaxID=1943633 RepID=A0ABX7FDI7_9RHOB|nr:Holliday junction branch migration protein RuvA [Ponticoccus alexandrii]KID12598.1 ATP-dependent DNA helicase RuvA [Rhodobacteraceae bacterium PD-2]QRF67897.1 Holliday junction branch migration protein RuvA [Ponticoccus alexandrii]